MTQYRFSSSLFPAGGHCEKFWHGQGCRLFDVVHPAYRGTIHQPRCPKDVLERLSWHATCLSHASWGVLDIQRELAPLTSGGSIPRDG